MSSTPTLADPEAMFFQASSFDYTATIIEMQVHNINRIAIKNKMIEWRIPTFVPATIISCFSVEIYFKYLYRVEQGKNPPVGHNLVNLFNQVSLEMQELVRKEYMHIETTHPDVIARNEAHKQATGQLLMPDFNKDLTASQHSFTRWRYYYETPTVAPGTNPQAIRVATREVIIKKYANCRAIWESFPSLW